MLCISDFFSSDPHRGDGGVVRAFLVVVRQEKEGELEREGFGRLRAGLGWALLWKVDGHSLGLAWLGSDRKSKR